MKIFTNEVRIALVAIAGVVVLFFGLQFLKGLSLFTNSNAYFVRFNDISGLSSSSPVYANGFKVGVVTNIEFDYAKGDIFAMIELDEDMRLPINSKAEIESDMLGNVKVNVVLAENKGEYVAVGDTITGGKHSGAMEKAAAMIPAIEKVLPKLDSIMGSHCIMSIR